MNVVFREQRYLVCDDWLAPEPLARLRAFLLAYAYFTVLRDGKRGPTGTLTELAPLLSERRVRLLGGKFVVRRLVDGPAGGQLPYPSGTPLDSVLESVDAALPEVELYLGKPGSDWQRLGAGPRLYPSGGGLAEHDDADSLGTFVLYAHERWEPSWGGGLSIDGRLVSPEPNRCVFVKGGTAHRVLPVSDEPPDRLRVSVIGYSRRMKRG